VGLFESDADVISNAADRQMVHVRTFQVGKYSALSQRLLNELSAARVCLLDPAKKAAYDDQLRTQMAVAVRRPVAVAPGGLSAAIPAAPPAPGSAWPPGQTADPRLAAPAAPAAAMSAPQPPIAPPADVRALFVPTPARSRAQAVAIKKPNTAWQVAAIMGVLIVAAVLTAMYLLNQPGGPDARTPTTSSDDAKAGVTSHNEPSSTPANKPVETAGAKSSPSTPAESSVSGVSGAGPGATAPELRLTVQPAVPEPNPSATEKDQAHKKQE
jgi:hypothetical protein